MTWNEFVAAVNQKLAALSLTGEEPVWYIDVTLPNDANDIRLGRDDTRIFIVD